MTAWFADQVVAEASTTSDEGLAARAEGVTASEAHAIAVGSRASWRRILDDKLNGSTFTGNRHTRRGHEREPFLLAHAAMLLGGHVEPNAALLRHPEHPLHMATPDAFGISVDRGGIVGVEAKSHGHGYTGTRIPADHFDQMQFGMWVTGAEWWLYVTEVMGEDGEPTLELPRFEWVARDDARIARLAAEADRFLAWRAAGAPDVDDIPAAVDDALAEWVEGDAIEREGKARKAAADTVIRAYLAEHPTATVEGLKRAGSRAHFVFAVTEKPQLDEEAWAQAEPAGYAEYRDMATRVAETAALALPLYGRPVRSTRLTITAKKDIG